jgi:WD40 repeat protein
MSLSRDCSSYPVQGSLPTLEYPLEILREHEAEVATIACVRGNNSQMLTGGHDRALKFWDVGTDTVDDEQSFNDWIVCSDMTPDGEVERQV